MNFSSFMISVVCCSLLQILAGVIIPEGRMRGFVMSIISVFLFFSLVYPLCKFIMGADIENLLFDFV